MKKIHQQALQAWRRGEGDGDYVFEGMEKR